MKFEDIKLKSIVCVTRYKPKSKSWSAENRRNHIIGVQLSGEASHNFGYQKFNISEHCIFFLNQKDNYSVKIPDSVDKLDSMEAYSVHFTTYEPIETDSFCIRINHISEAVRLLDKIETGTALTSSNGNIAFSCFYNLCVYFDAIRKKEYFPKSSRIQTAREYFDLHFKENDCLDSAARLCNVSRRRFNDLFRNQFDITPNAYLITRKCETAKQLLTTDALSVSEIAELCGFSDIYYFSKVFKRETGITPSDFRKAYRNNG